MEVLRLLAANRNPDSYVAGATVLNRGPATPRTSQDVDVFHDTVESASGDPGISLVDHGNQNTRHWARAALAPKTGQDFKQDKPAWVTWWRAQGHDPVQPKYLEPWAPPARGGK